MTLGEVSAATIFCGVAEVERIGALLADREVLEGTGGSMTLPTVAGDLTISPLEFDGPGRQFAQIILGASNAVRNGIVATTGGQVKVGELLANCDIILGRAPPRLLWQMTSGRSWHSHSPLRCRA